MNNAAELTTTAKNAVAAVEVRRPGVMTAENLMPLLDLSNAIRRRNFLVEATKTLMVEGVDYGSIPGTSSKPVLLKPGAEKLVVLFGMSAEVHEEVVIEDWDGTGEGHGGEPLFYYRLKCKLTRNEILLAEGIASCSSRESKFRYRAAERKCPKCGKAAIIRGREEYGGGWICFGKKGGCGSKFKDGDAAIESQPAGRQINPDAADVTNTVLKMAHKRALVSAALIACGASEFFSQDSEDLEVIDVPSAEPPREAKAKPADPDADPPGGSNAASQQAKTAPSAAAQPEFLTQAPTEGSSWPWANFASMIAEFTKLHGRLGSDYDHIYYETLREFGVGHCNEFRSYSTAQAAYKKLRSKVCKIEEARQAAGGVENAPEGCQQDPGVSA